MYSEVVVQTTNIPNDDSVTNSTTIVPEENQELTTNMIRVSPNKITMYQHSNHKRRLSNQYTHQYHSENKQQVYVSKNNEVCIIQSHDNDSSQKLIP